MTSNETNVSNYEFTTEQNSLIMKLSRVMSILGYLCVLVALVAFSKSFNPIDIIQLFSSTIFLVIGFSTIYAAVFLKNIVKTKGNDISNLMNALNNFYVAYSTQLFAIVVALVMIIIALVFGL
jgi:uncharacterized membrane protein